MNAYLLQLFADRSNFINGGQLVHCLYGADIKCARYKFTEWKQYTELHKVLCEVIKVE